MAVGNKRLIVLVVGFVVWGYFFVNNDSSSEYNNKAGIAAKFNKDPLTLTSDPNDANADPNADPNIIVDDPNENVRREDPNVNGDPNTAIDPNEEDPEGDEVQEVKMVCKEEEAEMMHIDEDTRITLDKDKATMKRSKGYTLDILDELQTDIIPDAGGIGNLGPQELGLYRIALHSLYEHESGANKLKAGELLQAHLKAESDQKYKRFLACVDKHSMGRQKESL